MKHQTQYSKSHNGQYGKPALYPEQLSVERHQLFQVLFPVKSVWNLEAREEYYKVRYTCEP